MNEISVEELAKWRREGRHFVLLDVREPFEVQAASIEGATHIPMRQVPGQLRTLDRGVPVAVLCHHGARSANVAAYLHANGFQEVFNVAGGIDAYARYVDPDVGSY